MIIIVRIVISNPIYLEMCNCKSCLKLANIHLYIDSRADCAFASEFFHIPVFIISNGICICINRMAYLNRMFYSKKVITIIIVKMFTLYF